jgi:photosystem II stability/assembly factor-like uncharacterized protein
MRKIFLLILFILFLHTPSFAQPQNWAFAGWYGGGMYPDIVLDTKVQGRVYLTSDVAGIWRSDDSGEHWYFINNGLKNLNVPLIAIAPSDSNILYAGTASGMMRSSDAGKTWDDLPAAAKSRIKFTRPGSYRSIAISSKNPNDIYAGSITGQLFHSMDGGKSWEKIKDLPFEEKVTITSVQDSNDDKFVFLSSTKGVIRFDISKNTFELVLHGDKEKSILDMLLYNQSGKDILLATFGNTFAYSNDYGDHWQYSNEIPNDDIINRIDAINQSSGLLVLVATQKRSSSESRIFFSKDMGNTWQGFNKHLHYDRVSDVTRTWLKGFGMPRGLKFDPFNPNVLYFTDSWGIWRSDDQGQNWNEKIKGAPNTSGSDLAVSSSGELYVATMDDGLTKSSDQGKSYVPLIPGGDIHSGGHIWRVLSLNNSSTKVVASGVLWNEQIDRIFIQKKGEDDFYKISSGLPLKNPGANTMWGSGYGRGLAVDPKNQNRLYLGIDGDDGGGLFISDDGGENWQRSSGQPDDLKIYNGLAVNPLHTNQIFWGSCGKSGGVYQSDDFGKSWKKSLSNLACVFDVHAGEDGTIYAAGSSNGPVLYASFDSGKSWKMIGDFDAGATTEAIATNPQNPKQLFVGTVYWNGETGGKIFYSPNEGKSWKDITDGLPENSGPSAMAIDPKNNLLYVLLYAGSVYKRDLGTL